MSRMNYEVVKQVEEILSQPVLTVEMINTCADIVRDNGGEIDAELDILLPLLDDDAKGLLTRCKKILYKMINGSVNGNVDKQIATILGKMAVAILEPELKIYDANENDKLLLANYLTGSQCNDALVALYAKLKQLREGNK